MRFPRELLGSLRDDLRAANFCAQTIEGLLGQNAYEAAQRGVFAPAVYALREHDGHESTAALIRLFILGGTLSDAEISHALPSVSISDARECGLLEATVNDEFRAGCTLEAVTVEHPSQPSEQLDLWVLSDLGDALRHGPAAPDHVMGVGRATRSLLSQAPIVEYANGPAKSRALDLGTGCGIIALVLAHAGFETVIATDISGRALEYARANALLNESPQTQRISFRLGNLYEPVEGERFDLIVSNPPFVITPRGTENVPAYTYRDGGFAGDTLAQQVIEGGSAHLTPSGEFFCLANWEYHGGVSGLSRVESWLDGKRLAAWIIERDRVTPETYSETWVRDGGARPGSSEFSEMQQAWLRDFGSRSVVSIGLGSVRYRLMPHQHTPTAHDMRLIRSEALGGALTKNAGREFSRVFALGIEVQQLSDAEMLSTHWLREDGVTELREHTPGEEAPRAIHLYRREPIYRELKSDTLVAAALGACDGDLSLGQLADALAALLEIDASATAEALSSAFRELAWLGMVNTAHVPRK